MKFFLIINKVLLQGTLFVGSRAAVAENPSAARENEGHRIICSVSKSRALSHSKRMSVL